MSGRTYRAILIVSALLGGFLLALPVWDWWAYRHLDLEPKAIVSPTRAGTGPHPRNGTAISPRAGGGLVIAAMAAPRVQPVARPRNVEPVPRPSDSRADREAAPRPPAPAAADPQGPAVRMRPPVPERSAATAQAGGVAGPVQRPMTHSPLIWARTLPIQVPLVAPPPEQQPAPVYDSAPDNGQDSSDAPAEPGNSPETGSLRLSLVPGAPTVDQGRILSVRVVLSGSEKVTSVPFHLRFDPALLEFLSARTGSAFVSSSLEPLLLASVNPERPGDLAVGLALVGDSRPLSTPGNLVVLEFRAIGRGRTDLIFENSSVRGVSSEPLPAEFANTSIQID